jgi:hypothetical protein
MTTSKENLKRWAGASALTTIAFTATAVGVPVVDLFSNGNLPLEFYFVPIALLPPSLFCISKAIILNRQPINRADCKGTEDGPDNPGATLKADVRVVPPWVDKENRGEEVSLSEILAPKKRF